MHPADRHVTEGEISDHPEKTRVECGFIDASQKCLLRVQCRHDTLARFDFRTVLQPDTHAFTIANDEFSHRGAGLDAAAVGLDVSLHRIGQHLAAALRYRLRVVVNTRNHDVETLCRAELVRQRLRRRGPA